MASSTGSSPACRRRSSDRCRRALAGLLFAGLALGAAAAGLPEYARQALAHFSPDVPAGWAYTLTTVRNEAGIRERFDPARPPAARWTLEQTEGRAPKPRELEQYGRARLAGTATAPQATFQKSDLDLGSFTLVREDAARGEFLGEFRAEAAGPDKMLGHLSVRLIVDRTGPHVEACVLELKAPYSPVLGVRMRSLVVRTDYLPPAEDRPSLPRETNSRFVGRIFFFGVEENLRVTYADYRRSP
ncbi:MAG: hypothetical protein JNG83_07210 [Opitutaceae bacterium]|nr:hypothetical protein [Opitutaceae bacterium]